MRSSPALQREAKNHQLILSRIVSELLYATILICRYTNTLVSEEGKDHDAMQIGGVVVYVQILSLPAGN